MKLLGASKPYYIDARFPDESVPMVVGSFCSIKVANPDEKNKFADISREQLY